MVMNSRNPSFGAVSRAITSPNGCAFHTFPGGLHYISLLLSLVFLVITIIMMLSGGAKIGTVIGVAAGSFVLMIGSIYANYYNIEGCHAKRVLHALKQRDHLEQIMKGEAEAETFSKNQSNSDE